MIYTTALSCWLIASTAFIVYESQDSQLTTLASCENSCVNIIVVKMFSNLFILLLSECITWRRQYLMSPELSKFFLLILLKINK